MLRPLLLVLGFFAFLLVGGLIVMMGFNAESGADAAPMTQRVSRPLALELPIDCAMPERCAVQFHVDRRTGPAIGDFRCNRLSYEAHRGTDFRVFAKEDFVKGIPVLAAAPGRVVAVRDGMEDIDVTELGRGKVEGRAGGNQVVIAHEDGWETYYWHMRKGSIVVQQDQVVTAGTKLGLVGLSGDTNFPHLHFELRRNRNVIVDPFDASTGDPSCRAPPQSLWTKSAAARLDYAPIVARVGFTTRDVTRADVLYERVPSAAAERSIPALFLWTEIYGVARGDRISLQWGLPNGAWREPAQLTWQDDLPYLFRTGRLGLPSPLPPGKYSVRLQVMRSESATALYDKVFSVAIE